MSADRRTDTWISLAVGLTLLLAILLIVVSFFRFQARHTELASLTLERTQQMLRLRLDGMFHELGEDLREEAAALERSPDPELSLLIDRWRPLMRSHWSVMAIRLADEHGGMIEYIRDGDDLKLVIAPADTLSRDAPIMKDTTTIAPVLSPDPSISYRDMHLDPRQEIWFGKALENTRGEPTWNIRYPNDTAPPILQASLLIRSDAPERPFRIIAMDVDLGRSNWMDKHISPLSRYGVLLLDGTGRTIPLPDQEREGILPLAEAKAASIWALERTPHPFTINIGDRDLRVLLMPYGLNGLTLYSGVLLDMEMIGNWTRTEERILIIAGVVALVLAFLLGWSAMRKRKENVRLKRQARRTRSQEKKLAKALGEREVLNREVHHRVKNNLQVVSSLLNLQATRLEEGPVRNEFIRGKKRIDMIALVHHKLYGSKDLRNVDMESFFRELITALARMHEPQSRTVSFEVDTNDLHTDQDTAIELGIILCELVSNSFQHAFPYATGGHVDILVRPVENDLFRLIVKDNGQGLREGYADGAGKLGLEIVDALAEQLDGSFHVRESDGVTFEVLFRMSRQPYADPLEA